MGRVSLHANSPDLIEAARLIISIIAAAIARVVQADAQVRNIRVGVAADGRRQRQRDTLAKFRQLVVQYIPAAVHRGVTSLNASLSASYTVHRFLGLNRAYLAGRRRERGGGALRARSCHPHHALRCRKYLFPGAERPGSSPHRTRQSCRAQRAVLTLIRQRFLPAPRRNSILLSRKVLVATSAPQFRRLKSRCGKASPRSAVSGRARTGEFFRPGWRYGLRPHSQAVTPGIPSDLLNQRPDIRQAEAALAVGQFQRRIRARSFFPKHRPYQPRPAGKALRLSALFGPGAWFYYCHGRPRPADFRWLPRGLDSLQLAKGRQLGVLVKLYHRLCYRRSAMLSKR